MQEKRIRGLGLDFANDGGEEAAPLVTLIAPGANGTELALEVAAGCPEFRYQLYSPGISNLHEEVLRAARIRFTRDLDCALWHFSSPDAALSFGLLPHQNHLSTAILTALLSENGIPVHDVQHGLFQWGVSFVDDSLEQGFGNLPGVGLSGDLRTLADSQLCWWGDGAIGYPRHRGLEHAEDLGYALIATNTNWHIYPEEERHRAISAVLAAVTACPQQRFIWKPHPAELNPNLSPLAEMLRDHGIPNLDVIEALAHRGDMLCELARKCSFGIATVGTALLDFEMFEKPCLVFESRAVSELIHELEDVRTFRGARDLEGLLVNPGPQIRTGRLESFQPDRLREVIGTASGRSGRPDLSRLLRHLEMAANLGMNTTH